MAVPLYREPWVVLGETEKVNGLGGIQTEEHFISLQPGKKQSDRHIWKMFGEERK